MVLQKSVRHKTESKQGKQNHIIYKYYQNTAFRRLYIHNNSLMELQRTNYHNRSLLYTHPIPYND